MASSMGDNVVVVTGWLRECQRPVQLNENLFTGKTIGTSAEVEETGARLPKFCYHFFFTLNILSYREKFFGVGIHYFKSFDI